MRKGELTTAPLLPVLRSLADDATTGCLRVVDPEDREARVYVRDGRLYSVTVPGRWQRLGARLVSSGELAPDALAEALEVQRTELQGWRLGELLVYLGFVDQAVIERIVSEQLHDAVWDLLGWQAGTWRFRPGEATRDELVPPTEIDQLVESLRERSDEWNDICTLVPGPWVVPELATRSTGLGEMALDSDAWSLLCKVDGRRSVADLAYECGHTLFEASQVLMRLMRGGLVELGDARPRSTDDGFADSIARVSQALSEVLGPSPAGGDPYAVPGDLDTPFPAGDTVPQQQPDEDWRRAQQIRAAAAAELAAAHAMAEAMHQQALEEEAAAAALPMPVVDTEPTDDAGTDAAIYVLGPPAGAADECTDEYADVEETPTGEAVEELDTELTDDAGIGAAIDFTEIDDEPVADVILEEPVDEPVDEPVAELVEEPVVGPDPEELRLRAEQQSAAAALLSELAAHDPIEPMPAPSADEEPALAYALDETAPPDEPAPAEERLPVVDREHTDTAALLRELSSLGVDDDPAPAPLPPPRTPPAQRTALATDRKTKKRGFFGL